MLSKIHTKVIIVIQSLSHVQLFVIPWTLALQASLSITNSWSLLKLMSIDSVMSSNHLILCHPLLLPPSIFSSRMRELDCEGGWAPKNWCLWTVVLEKTLERPLHCKEIHPVHPKGDSPGCSLEELMLKLKLNGILQARILKWIAIPFSKGASRPRDWTQVSGIAHRFFTVWATREAPNF